MIDSLLRLLGRLHPAVVHFPIALLVVAAALEAWQIIRRKPNLAPATPACVFLGTVGAAVASLLGWFLAEGDDGSLLDLHKWIGFATTGLAVVAAVLAWSTGSPAARRLLRPTLFVAASLVGFAGYLGGELVFGRDHIFKGIFPDEISGQLSLVLVSTKDQSGFLPVQVGDLRSVEPIDFARDVSPILKDHCLRCHGGEKTKGKLSLLNWADAKKGGRSGPCIEPGRPDQSLLYTLLVESDPKTRMPPPQEKRLSREQMETIRRWIVQGAQWPDDAEIK